MGDRELITQVRDGERYRRKEGRDMAYWSCDHIDNWGHWDRTVHETIVEFIAEFDQVPNMLFASTVTHRRIDIAANKANLRGPNGETFEEGEYTPLSCFSGPGYRLEMYIDDELEDGWFAVIWDREFAVEELAAEELAAEELAAEDLAAGELLAEQQTAEEAPTGVFGNSAAVRSDERRPQARATDSGSAEGGSSLGRLNLRGLLNMAE